MLKTFSSKYFFSGYLGLIWLAFSFLSFYCIYIIQNHRKLLLWKCLSTINFISLTTHGIIYTQFQYMTLVQYKSRKRSISCSFNLLWTGDKCGTMVWWLSLLHNFIQQSLNSGSAQSGLNPARSMSEAIVRISDNGPGWK